MCDVLCALGSRTTDGVTLFAKNSDRPPDEPQAVEWHPPRREARTRATHVEIPGHPDHTLGFVGSRPTWMWGVEHGVNTAAVAIGNETIFTTLDPRGAAPALVGMDLVRLGLERADTAAAAVDVITSLLEAHGQGGSGHRDADRPYWSSFMIADPGAAYVLETSGRAWMVEAVSGTRAISNRTTIPAFDAAHRHPRQPVGTLVDPRWRASGAVLAKAPIDRAMLTDHLRAHVGGEDGWTVCMHVEGVEATTASIVARLPEPSVDAPTAWFLLGSPCCSVYVPVTVGEPLGPVPAWERFARLGPQHRAALDALEAELDASLAVAADGGTNARAWALVARTLADLAV
ncbi:MAG: peptidase dipeptidase [Acidimicrobiales bacterium]|nr:peptidase dipeptidase [Acidimicrobiales bacterium]